MPLRDPLAATIRLTREARGLTKDDFSGLVDPKHVYNLENSRTSVTLDTLESLASALEVDPIAMLVIAGAYERQQSPAEFLKYLGKQAKAFREMGVVDGLPHQFEGGVLIPQIAGRRVSQEKVDAVLRCKAEGMTQKEASVALGIPTSTVARIWKRDT